MNLTAMFSSLAITTTAVLLLLTSAASAVQLRQSGSCIPRERDALLEFKKGIASDPIGLLASWREEDQDCCRWRGIRCSNLTGHILKLNIRNNINPFGDYHTYRTMRLVGKISHSLLSLQHLQHLDLSQNSLQGPTGYIPEFLGSLKNLRYLNLSGIPFHGLVPPHLGNLSSLQVLDISYTTNSYSADISWVTHLPRLWYLNMGDSNLSMVVDWPQVVNVVSSLKVLDLTSCNLATANQWLPHLNLTNLEELRLPFNKFYHPIAFCWFWNIKSLKYLDLGSTSLYGQIPDSIGNLTSLEVLDFSGLVNLMENHVRGIVVANMTNLCNLRILDVSSSLSHGNIAEILERFPRCPSNRLNKLSLDSNNISGNLPDWIGKFAGIVELELSNNRLLGFLPSGIGMLTNLTTIDLSGNYMDGLITEEHFAGLASLKYIWLRGNSFKIVFDSEWLPPFRLINADFSYCQLGPLFPTWLQLQVDIATLDISNAGIVDVLPDWFWTTFSMSTYLDIGNNTISGKLPANMETISVEFLRLRSNQFFGGIPRLPRNLTILDISKNSLSGPLPQNIGAPSIQVLDLAFNYFTGSITASICEWQFLDELSLEHNHFEGELPQCFGTRHLTGLFISNNRFSGMFPSFLQTCKMVEVVDLSRNRFTGRLPMWVGDLTELQFLRLSYNLFSGSIPQSITNLRNLYVLDLASNSLSDALPLSLSNLTAMTTSYTRYDQYDGVDHEGYLPVITKHQELYYGYTRFPIGSIDLSSNQLSGVVPEGIVCLDALKNLNLSWNYLSGKIPDKLGIINSLESLDLSRNRLFGEIPQSLSNLTSLSYLDLSYNNLAGVIPSGSQLDSLYSENPNMYSGNDGLCGPPLQKNCSSGHPSQQVHFKRNREDHELDTFYFGLLLGFTLGIWAIFCSLLFKKAWRVAYFHLFDKLYDKAYTLVAVTWARFTRKTAAN